MKKLWAVLLAVTVVAVPASVRVGADIIEQILVKVNGDIFTKTDLETRQVAALRQLGREIGPNPGDERLRQLLEEVTPELIVSVVDEILLVQRGRDLGYRLTDERFTAILDNMKKENKLENDEVFEAALKQENMTLADLRKSIERQMLASQVQQNEVLSKIAVSDEDARTYYDGHRAEFTSSPSVTLREILVTVPGGGTTLNVGLDEEARDKATKLRERALAGESFETLASEASDAPSRANAGLIGPLSLSELSSELKQLINSMKQGQVTEILRGPRGYQILKLESLTNAETMSYEQAREAIGNRVFTDKRRVEYDRFMDRLRSEAIIEWKSQELRKAYDRGIDVLKAGAKKSSTS